VSSETSVHTAIMNLRIEGSITIFVSLPFFDDHLAVLDTESKRNDTISIMHGLAWAVCIYGCVMYANHNSLPF
jgi:hypothetical protein